MIRALLEGRKTQTRRVVKPQPEITIRDIGGGCAEVVWHDEKHTINAGGGTSNVGLDILQQTIVPRVCRIGRPGDRLWVRETWRHDPLELGEIRHRATCCELKGETWKPSIFMPRSASRITLEITDVRVERLWEITEDDAVAEGIPKEDVCPGGDTENFHPPGAYGYVSGVHPFPKGEIYPKARGAFHELWDSINAKRGYGWKKNPWVWVVEFRKCEPSTK